MGGVRRGLDVVQTAPEGQTDERAGIGDNGGLPDQAISPVSSI